MVTFSSLKPLKHDLKLLQAEEGKLILTKAQSHAYRVQLELEKGILSARVFEIFTNIAHELIVEELHLPLARDHYLSYSQAQKLIRGTSLRIRLLHDETPSNGKPLSVIVELRGKLLGGGGGCSKASAIKPYDADMTEQLHVETIPLGQGQDAQAMSGIRLIEQGVNGSDEDFIVQGLALLQRSETRALNNPLQPMRVLMEILTSESGQWIRASIKCELAEQAHRLSMGVHRRQQQAGIKVYEQTKVAMLAGLERLSGITSQSARGEAVLAGHLSLLQGSAFALLEKKANYNNYIQSVLSAVLTRDVSHLTPLLIDFMKHLHHLYQRHWHGVTILIEGMKLLALQRGELAEKAFEDLMIHLVEPYRHDYRLSISNVLALKEIVAKAQTPKMAHQALHGYKKLGGLLSFLDHPHELVRAMTVSCCFELRDLTSLHQPLEQAIAKKIAIMSDGPERHQSVMQILRNPLGVLEAKRSLLVAEPTQLSSRSSSNHSSGSSSHSDSPLAAAAVAPLSPVSISLIPAHRFWQVPLANSNFIGRKATLKALQAKFSPQNPDVLLEGALVGLSGSGKSTLAAKFCADHAASFSHIFWLRAESESSLMSDLQALSAALSLPASHLPYEMINNFHSWLKSNPHWLLVLDNMQDSLLYQQIRPACGGSILVTTIGGEGWVNPLPLSVYSPEEAVEFLTMSFPEDNLEAVLKIARQLNFQLPTPAQLNSCLPEDLPHFESYRELIELARELGFQPLALSQAVDYMLKTSTSYKDYRQLYCYERSKLENQQSQFKGFQTPASSALILQLKLMESRLNQVSQEINVNKPATMDLLRFCAMLPHDRIPIDILLSFMGKELTPVQARLELNRALRLPLSYCLVKIEKKEVSLNKLVQVALLESASIIERKRALYMGVDAALRAWEYPEDYNEKNSTYRVSLLDCYLNILKGASRLELHSRNLLGLCNYGSAHCSFNGLYQKGLEFCNLGFNELKFHQQCERVYSEILENKVALLSLLERYDEAFELVDEMNSRADFLEANPELFEKQGREDFTFYSTNTLQVQGDAKARLIQKAAFSLTADETGNLYDKYEHYLMKSCRDVATIALAHSFIKENRFTEAYSSAKSLMIQEAKSSAAIKFNAQMYWLMAKSLILYNQYSKEYRYQSGVGHAEKAYHLSKESFSNSVIFGDIALDYAYFGSLHYTNFAGLNQMFIYAGQGLITIGRAIGYDPKLLKERIEKFKAVRAKVAEVCDPRYKQEHLKMTPPGFAQLIDPS